MYHQHPPISTNYLQIAADVEQMSNSRSSLISTSFRQFQNGLLFCLIPPTRKSVVRVRSSRRGVTCRSGPWRDGHIGPWMVPWLQLSPSEFRRILADEHMGISSKTSKKRGVQRFNQTKHSAWKLGRWTWHYPMDQSWNLNRIMRIWTDMPL